MSADCIDIFNLKRQITTMTRAACPECTHRMRTYKATYKHFATVSQGYVSLLGKLSKQIISRAL
jgi:ssDNA-binding Zn-finger/Zn-ribbon topoisomerase 1